MSIHLKNAIFFHIPKTGGTFVHRALEVSGVKITPFQNGVHNTYKEEKKEDLKEKYLIAFVRHPYYWYRSYWAHRIERCWEMSWWLDKNCRDKDFEKFIQKVLNIGVPYLSNSYTDYIGKPSIVDFVGKQEYLIDDLIHALRFIEEDFDESEIKKLNKQNITTTKPKCSKELKQKLLELEKEAMETFYYERHI